ncbi:MAG TPA: amidase family protein [Acidimicrobiales bacterium]
MGSELWQESASSLAAMIRSGATTSREVVDAHLARINDVNEALNAVVEVRPDEVRAEADAAGAKQKSVAPFGPLHGVPFTIKVNLESRATPATRGAGGTLFRDDLCLDAAEAIENVVGALTPIDPRN